MPPRRGLQALGRGLHAHRGRSPGEALKSTGRDTQVGSKTLPQFRLDQVSVPCVQFDRVSLSFGSTPVLRELSWQAPAGRITAILGPNGAGKTTTMLVCEGDRQSTRLNSSHVASPYAVCCLIKKIFTRC